MRWYLGAGSQSCWWVYWGILQRDTLAPIRFITILANVLLFVLLFTATNTRVILEIATSRRYRELPMCDLDSADDIAMLATVIDMAENLLQI